MLKIALAFTPISQPFLTRKRLPFLFISRLSFWVLRILSFSRMAMLSGHPICSPSPVRAFVTPQRPRLPSTITVQLQHPESPMTLGPVARALLILSLLCPSLADSMHRPRPKKHRAALALLPPFCPEIDTLQVPHNVSRLVSRREPQ